MPILNYTTGIDSYKTITEIQQILAKAGATKFIIDNDSAKNPVAITFCLDWNGQQVGYALPCNFEGVLRSMKSTSKVPRNKCNQEQALRVGCRILKTWIQAQLAIVETEMASIPEVFLPYAVVPKSGNTLFKHLEQNKTLLIAVGNY